ncbi:glycosyltransferase family 4 protein [Methanosarcina sp. WH1]|uniref:glycosyltransferase family 4 protein n=1 Tax=Methanosarcina sp. WH1 TaxID=1434102 RepID=UPI000615EC34|nr:glycosyltransferase family 4 protein [Methanosarcina sp. WH1]AKB23277.1 glycosyltransferase [Methanosarcina sp. WH1]
MVNKNNRNEIDICIISPSPLETNTVRGGGCGVMDYNVALELSKYYKVSIISAYYKKYQGSIKINNNFTIEQVFIPAPKNYPFKSKLEATINFFITYLFSLLVAVKISKLIQKNLKIIIVHNPQTAFLSILLAKVRKVKIIYSEGNTTPWTDPYVITFKRNLLQKLFHLYNLYFSIFACKLVDKIRTQSNSIKKGMVQYGIDPKKIKVIATGVEINIFKPNKEIEKKETNIKIGFIGRLTEIKGVNLLVQIVQKSITELPDVRFQIFGEGPYKKYFIDLPNVEHLGAVPRNKLNGFLSKLDIILFFQKELGRAEVEAMSSGRAIIACRMGEMTEMINHLENGILCAPEPNEYIKAIKYLSGNSILREKISKNARMTAENSFTWESIGAQWKSLCSELIGSKKMCKNSVYQNQLIDIDFDETEKSDY